MRHLISDTGLIRQAGYSPSVDLEEGIIKYLDWIRSQGAVQDYFSSAEVVLRQKRILQSVEPVAPHNQIAL
jgi:dTDP-L-rhamnose 4-epimerase